MARLAQSTIYICGGNESRDYKCMRDRNEDATDVHHTLDAIAHYAALRKALGSFARRADN